MGVTAFLPIIGDVLDRVLPDKEAREKAKLAMLEMEQRGELSELATKAGVVKAEIQGESWLQRTWRPILMLAVVAIVANNYLLFPYINLFFPESAIRLDLPDPLWNLMSIGVGGYVVGRSGEKAVKAWKNAD